jgi:hypothetical protein
LGFARGQLDSFPALEAAYRKKVPTDRNVLAGKKPDGP